MKELALPSIKRPADELSSLGLKKKAKADTSKVSVDGKKLRAGTIPWRHAIDQEVEPSSERAVEVFLIESINTPGQWAFPGGSLDPGEEVATCAIRETGEECGAVGSLGAFLGSFENEKNWSYIFLMRVHTVHDSDNEWWTDPDSAYESDGRRRRRWFRLESARPLLKKDGVQILDAFLAVRACRREDSLWRPSVSVSMRPPALNILVLGGSAELRRDVFSGRGNLLRAGDVASEEGTAVTNGQRFSMIAAALWEADVVICVGGVERVFDVGLATARGRPILFLHTACSEAVRSMSGDSRVTVMPLFLDVDSRKDVLATQRAVCRKIDEFLSKHLEAAK